MSDLPSLPTERAVGEVMAIMEWLPGLTKQYVRQLEDACEVLWAELPAEQVASLHDEAPRLVEFLRQIHHELSHEQVMTRRNVWSEAP